MLLWLPTCPMDGPRDGPSPSFLSHHLCRALLCPHRSVCLVGVFLPDEQTRVVNWSFAPATWEVS